jgi:hypothetical protein
MLITKNDLKASRFKNMAFPEPKKIKKQTNGNTM